MFRSSQQILIVVFDDVLVLIRFDDGIQCGPSRSCLGKFPGLLKFSPAMMSDGDVDTSASSRPVRRVTYGLKTPGVAHHGNGAGSCTTSDGNHPADCVVER